jgi:Xaa-Pro aminopeptidase
VVAAGRAPVRANDTQYGFRPHSDFCWLTGCTEAEDAVLVLSAGSAVLYMPAPAYAGEKEFFASAARGELWVGAAPGLEDWSAALGLEVRSLSALDDDLGRLSKLVVAGPLSAELAGRLGGMEPDPDLARVLSELRMIKDEWEVGQLREAVNQTVSGFAAVVREFPAAIAGGGERWLQGTFDRHARTYGNGPGYASIVGSGPHAPTLHWVRCDGPVLPDEVVLLDMGVEARSLYTADVTRTFPATGRFSPAQRQVHDLVEKAHRAGLEAVRPGRPYTDFTHALSPQGQQHRRYLVCGIGHHLGLDVHDCANASDETYKGGTLAPGMVLTVEPGLYFHAHDLTVPPELRGIGVRIEDDLLVTEAGAEVLSAALPLTADGLETWMAGA